MPGGGAGHAVSSSSGQSWLLLPALSEESVFANSVLEPTWGRLVTRLLLSTTYSEIEGETIRSLEFR